LVIRPFGIYLVGFFRARDGLHLVGFTAPVGYILLVSLSPWAISCRFLPPSWATSCFFLQHPWATSCRFHRPHGLHIVGFTAPVGYILSVSCAPIGYILSVSPPMFPLSCARSRARTRSCPLAQLT